IRDATVTGVQTCALPISPPGWVKAMAFTQPGGVDVLQLVDLPVPSIDDDEVLIEVKACALNHLDLWVRQGLPTKITMPHVGGCEIGRASCRQRRWQAAVE